MSVRCSQPQVANLGGFNWHRLEGGAINVALLTANVWHRWNMECRDLSTQRLQRQAGSM